MLGVGVGGAHEPVGGGLGWFAAGGEGGEGAGVREGAGLGGGEA